MAVGAFRSQLLKLYKLRRRARLTDFWEYVLLFGDVSLVWGIVILGVDACRGLRTWSEDLLVSIRGDAIGCVEMLAHRLRPEDVVL